MSPLTTDRGSDRRPLFLDVLVGDLKPVRRSGPWSQAMFVWCAISWGLVSLVILTLGPLRENITAEILGSPRLMLEITIGILAGVAAIAAGLELGVPGTPSASRLWLAPFLLFAGWVFVIGFEGIQPAGPSLPGEMRKHCFLETLLVSLPSAIAALYLLEGRIAFQAGRAGLLTGAAAAATPALWMELACAIDPVHALAFHLSAILVIGAVTALFAHRLVQHV